VGVPGKKKPIKVFYPFNGRSNKRPGPGTAVLTLGIMIIFWVLFSGRFDFFHLSLGVAASCMVSAVSHRLLFPRGLSSGLFKCWIRFLAYLPWLFNQIFQANLHLLYLAFHPRMMDKINPKVIHFNSKLNTDISRTTLANSITLTPGTITIYAGTLGTFTVHCIDDRSGKGLPGDMEEKIFKVFNES
jgi:multicomponent Na+:H+ antiporter subunit E